MPVPSRRPLIHLVLAAALAVPAAALLAQGRAATPAQIAGARVPEPRDVFGFRPGDDYKLASHEQIVDYFRKLDAASDRVVVEEIGKSTEGRPMITGGRSRARPTSRTGRVTRRSRGSSP